MLDARAQHVLYAKVRYKLTVYRPSASSAEIERATHKAVEAVREDDDMLFDMLVDVAVRLATDEMDTHAAS